MLQHYHSIYPTSRPARRVNNAQSQSEYKLALVGSAFSYADRLVRLVKEDVPTENQCEFDEVDCHLFVKMYIYLHF